MAEKGPTEFFDKSEQQHVDKITLNLKNQPDNYAATATDNIEWMENPSSQGK
jgi:hypothetical protein